MAYTPTGNLIEFEPEVRNRANKKSFHVLMVQNIAVAARAGEASRIVIFRKALNLLNPSTIAAS
jgi:hypothetical protein